MTTKLLIFWDYDTQFGADRSRQNGPHDWGHLEFENTDRLLELHDRFGVPACFAVVGAAALPGQRPYQDPDQIRQIHAMGHEIASHSFFHEWLPALNYNELITTLRDSKDALEQCIGKPVTAFVPPYNQPFDFMRRGSISLSERRAAGRTRTDIPILCRALAETGYSFARISYRTPIERFQVLLNQTAATRPSAPENINGVTCLRLNNAAGFGGKVLKALTNPNINSTSDRYIIAYGHPHSLHTGNAQDEKHLVPFLETVQSLVSSGAVQLLLPAQILLTNRVGTS
jgi:peptidoglycan/xylan/chitin deacetylase (PgdA/CDA1 family)